MQKLHVGCGKDYREGYINLDISNDVGADVVRDITRGLPFNDDSFDEVVANNVLTQIDRQDFLFVMNELWRITKQEGKIEIRVPLVSDLCAFQDPMDNLRFTNQSFTYMQYDHRRYDQYGRHYGFKPFKVEILEDNGKQMKVCLTPIKE